MERTSIDKVGLYEQEEELLLEDLSGNDAGETSQPLLQDAIPSLSCAKPKKASRAWSVSRWALAFMVTACVLIGGRLIFSTYLTEPLDGQSPPWYPTPRGGIALSWAESYAKAARMVARMTLVEKVNITTGTGWQMGPSVGNTAPAVHVGFPALALQDGPLGIRFCDNCTAFPAAITAGSTWNKELMFKRGKALGLEARLKGINVLLGPCVGPIGRMPAGGRNWEGFGADPYIQGIAGAATVKGIQSEHVMATIKHFVANEQEHFRRGLEWGLRHAISANIDDRALHEIYAWPFADAIKAGVASVMCAYNMVNNSYACGNSKLMNGILKDEMGFQGFVMSDWLAQTSGISTALAGLDMSMPGDGLIWSDGESLWGPRLTIAVLNGSLPIQRLNDMATRIVASWYQLGQDNEDLFDRQGPNFSSWDKHEFGVEFPGSPTKQQNKLINHFVDVQGDHFDIARQVASEGTVLLKNHRTLPLSRQGLTGDTMTRVAILGEDAGPGKGPNFCTDRACNQGTLGSGWGSGAAEFPYLVSPLEALERNFDHSKVTLSSYLANDFDAGKLSSFLAEQDICLVFANSDSGEGYLSSEGVRGDRNDLELQKGGSKLIKFVAQNCGNGNGDTIVVIHSVGAVIMETWIDLPEVKAVLLAHLPGQESGNSIAEVLFGDVNPSGKLPYTIGKSPSDYGEGAKVMYLPNAVVPQQSFSEGLYIDYRHFDKFGIEPRFEFGFGLSYTSFQYSNLRAISTKGKSALPAPRPAPGAAPPDYDLKKPSATEALFPSEIRRLKKYVYPYLESVDQVESGPYDYPPGYFSEPPLSGSGGDEGGNPDLWETYATVSVDVHNDGQVGGKAVAQLYLSYPESSTVDFPVRVLRGFDKIFLESGQQATVIFNLSRRDLSYWNVDMQTWVIEENGEYMFSVGSSSRDLPVHVNW